MDRLGKAIAHYQRVHAYRATIKSVRLDGGEIIRYAWQRPGRIRMEFEKPHKGARLIYDPDNNRVYLWPFGGNFLPPMNLAPDNPLLRSPSGQRVDRSDVGALLENIQALQKTGHMEALGMGTIGTRVAMHVAVAGRSGASIGQVHRYDVWFDDETDFPLKIVSRDREDREIETVLLEDVVIDPDFPPDFFVP